MADNITLNAGAGGATLATDDAGAGGHVQIVKLALSADASATPITADTGGLLVNLGANNDVTVTGAVDLGATDNAVLDAIAASVAGATPAGTNNIGDVDVLTIAAGDNNIGNVDIVTVPAPLSTTGSGTEATALRVTLATDSTGVVSVDDNGGSLTVDGSVSISGTVDTELTTADLDTGAGTDTRAVVGLVGSASGGGALIPGSATDGLLVNLGANNDVTVTGTVAVTQSGTWDEVGINDSGNSITVDNAALSVVGGGLEATALRVTIASDSTGVVSVDDGGGALTVDGTVTANLSAVDNAVLDAIAASVAGTVVVDGSAVTQPVSAASLPLPTGASTAAKQPALGTAGTASADVITVQGIASMTALVVDGSGVTQPISHGALTELAAAIDTEVQCDIVGALPAGTNAIGKLAANSGVDIGDVDVTSIAAGANSIGNVGIIPRTTGGMTIFRSLDIDESEEDVKTSAGQVFSISAFNTTAAPLYLKFYNATAANVTVGSTTPVLTFVVPGNADSDGAGFIWNNEIGFAFGTAICVACTTGVADADTGAPGANACIVNIGYA